MYFGAKKTIRDVADGHGGCWLFYQGTSMLLSLDSSMDCPVMYSSTFLAHSRPSLMAQTTSD